MNGRQAITWNSGDPVHWLIHTSPAINMLRQDDLPAKEPPTKNVTSGFGAHFAHSAIVATYTGPWFKMESGW